MNLETTDIYLASFILGMDGKLIGHDRDKVVTFTVYHNELNDLVERFNAEETIACNPREMFKQLKYLKTIIFS